MQEVEQCMEQLPKDAKDTKKKYSTEDILYSFHTRTGRNPGIINAKNVSDLRRLIFRSHE